MWACFWVSCRCWGCGLGVTMMRCVTQHNCESGRNGGRRTTEPGWVWWVWFMFLLRQRAVYSWLWWIGMLLTLPHTHAHTCPTHSSSHTTTCVFLLTHGHTSTRLKTGMHTVKYSLLRPNQSDIQCEVFITHPRSLPPMSISFSHKCCICDSLSCRCARGSIWGLLLSPPSQVTHVHHYCTMNNIVKNMWLLKYMMTNVSITVEVFTWYGSISHIIRDGIILQY